MAKALTLATSKNDQSVASYLKTLPAAQRADATTLLELFRNATHTEPKLWGSSIIGFGEYDYTRSNGDYGTFLACGFAMRKSGPTLYIMPGYNDYSDILAKLGPYKLGKSCLYLKNLNNIHLPSVTTLIKAGVADLKKTHTVRMH